jgi:CDP-4-dehydro-6-deoxyglucose reductase
LIEHAMALDVAERILLFWVADNDETNYLNNLCRAWNDALDNFEYVPLGSESLQDIKSHIQTKLEPADPGGFDYYVCGTDRLQLKVKQYAARQMIPDNQLLFEAI